MSEKQNPRNLLKRYILLFTGLMIMSLGVAFSIKAELGTAPISSLPYVISLFTPLTVGKVSICMHCCFVLLQILILRKEYQLVQLMQIPVAVMFGYMTDFSVWLVQYINYASYWQQWMFCIISILLIGIGVSFEVTANVFTLAGEGVILAICKVTSVKFGNMKVIFDVSLVLVSCLCSFCAFSDLEGVREGTFAAAVFVGLTAKQVNKLLKRIENGSLAVIQK